MSTWEAVPGLSAPQNSARGTYNLQYIWVSDDAANLLKHDTAEAVASAGIATSFTVQ